MNTQMDVNAIDSGRFTWDKENKSLVIEISDLHDFNIYQKIYSDAADRGFAIRSSRTGKVELFYYCETVKNDEGEIQYWRFRPVNKLLRLKIQEVLIFND